MSRVGMLRALYRQAREAGIPDEITHGYLRFGVDGMTPAAREVRAEHMGMPFEGFLPVQAVGGQMPPVPASLARKTTPDPHEAWRATRYAEDDHNELFGFTPQMPSQSLRDAAYGTPEYGGFQAASRQLRARIEEREATWPGLRWKTPKPEAYDKAQLRVEGAGQAEREAQQLWRQTPAYRDMRFDSDMAQRRAEFGNVAARFTNIAQRFNQGLPRDRRLGERGLLNALLRAQTPEQAALNLGVDIADPVMTRRVQTAWQAARDVDAWIATRQASQPEWEYARWYDAEGVSKPAPQYGLPQADRPPAEIGSPAIEPVRYGTDVFGNVDQVRSRNATFDPARRRWNNMLAGLGAGGLLTALGLRPYSDET
jgi:hypothetical protein